MPNYRKALRDQIKLALSASTTGFNAAYAAVRGTYGTESMSIDFTAGSHSFVQSYLSEQDVAESQVLPEESNCGMVVYTSSAVNTNVLKHHQFSGQVAAHIDFYVRYEDGIKDDDTESTCDAVEDAIVAALNAYAFVGPVAWNRQYACDRQPMLPLAVGWQQRIPIFCTFDVHVS